MPTFPNCAPIHRLPGMFLQMFHTRTRTELYAIEPGSVEEALAVAEVLRSAANACAASAGCPDILTPLALIVDDHGAPMGTLLPLAAHGDVERYIRRRGVGALTFQEALQLLLPAARGLAHMHADGWLHRRVDVRNIFLADDGSSRLAVSHSAVHGFPMEDHAGFCGAVYYMAPELMRRNPRVVYSDKSDVYAFGVMAAQVLNSCLTAGVDVFPRMEDHPHRLVAAAVDAVRRTPRHAGLAHTLLACVEVDPDRRPSMADVLKALQAEAAWSELRSAWLGAMARGAVTAVEDPE
jgi:serine/threonine protein kinase